MDFSIAGCVKGDRLFVFTPQKNGNRLFLSKVGRDMWQRGPAHLYRQTRCRLPQIDHQLGSKSSRCRLTITLALCGSADHQRQIDVQFSERRGWLWRSTGGGELSRLRVYYSRTPCLEKQKFPTFLT